MKKDKVVILGSTGSIGTQTIDVIRTVGDKEIIGLAAHKNVDLLIDQVKATGAKHVAIFDGAACKVFKEKIKKEKDKKCRRVKVYEGMKGLIKLATLSEARIVVVSVVGMIGIRPTIEAIKKKKIICLANKETLVCAGDIIIPLAKKKKVEIRPIDSEHSAIWQCLQGEKHDAVEKLIITASGGPFYGRKTSSLKNVKVEDALKHPNWKMGRKITIDSATLVNKGLEVMEAHHLFDMPYDMIDVVVQRESIIHSMVEFKDGAVKAELGVPSMKVPIEYALYKENRKYVYEKTIDFKKLKSISIGSVDLDTFKGLRLAYLAIEKGNLMPAVYNALNEVAFARFLDRRFKFLDIADFIEEGMKRFEKEKLNKKKFKLKDIEDTMTFAKNFMENMYD